MKEEKIKRLSCVVMRYLFAEFHALIILTSLFFDPFSLPIVNYFSFVSLAAKFTL